MTASVHDRRGVPLERPLEGRTVWVTGASRGIGRALASGLARAGARLAVTSRARSDLESLKDELPGQDVLIMDGSVTDAERMSTVADRIAAKMGSLDVLITVAGINPVVRRSEELDNAAWQHVVDVNLTGTFFCCRAAASHMLEAGSGSIITISSVHGSTGVARMAAYAASKGAIESLTRSLAIEWAQRGVRVNCLAPGYIRTDLTAAYLDSRNGDQVISRIPMGLPGRPEDLVGAAIFLASDASSYMTGAIVAVDGGWTAV
jgi:NAD(P)-dependent dehydrogenase (short-subunit alcohol dehydrogenase family)